MSDEKLFRSVMQKVCKAEFAAFEDVPKHSFSRGFDRKIERLEREEPGRTTISLRRRRTLILIAIIAAVIAACGFATFKILFVADSTDETWLMLSATAGNPPKTIQHYYLPRLPENFYPDEDYISICTDDFYTEGFTDGLGHIHFMQRTVEQFKTGFEKGKVSLVNNITDDTIDVLFNDSIITTRIWSDGEYVYQIGGSLDCFEGTEFKDLYEVYPEVGYGYY